MPNQDRRRMVALMGAAAAGLGSAKITEGQAPPKATLSEAGEARQRLAKTLRELNEVAGLGVSDEDLDRTETYATGALLEAEAKLRPLPLDPGLDLSVTFAARRRR